MHFSDFDLPEPLSRAVQDMGFETPTPIQEQALPPLLDGRDVAGQAQTGTGKTACFLLTAMTRLLDSERPASGNPRALIVAPTRELAIQIAEDADQIGMHTELEVTLCYGGTGWDKQARDLEKGCDIVVGTPGRLMDYYRRGILRTSNIEVFVVDEADRMFDMGFIRDIQFLFSRIPPREKRQALLFSATLSQNVLTLAYRHMTDPIEVLIEPDVVMMEQITQELYHVGLAQKFSLLLGLLARESPQRALIFVNTKRDGEELTWRLNQNGYQVAYMSGDIPQKKRQRIIEAFKQGMVGMLVATDVASRGLHVDNVSHVINFDVPGDPEDYVHRAGRTARAGATGMAITLACENHVYNLPAIEKFIGAKVPLVEITDEVLAEDTGGRFRRRRGRTYCGWPPEGDASGDGPMTDTAENHDAGRQAGGRRGDRGRGAGDSGRGGGGGGQGRDRARQASGQDGGGRQRRRRRRGGGSSGGGGSGGGSSGGGASSSSSGGGSGD